MHEMSVIAGVLQIAEEQALAAGARVVNTIEMEIGQLAGVETESLRFCFQVARRGTMAEEAELVIRHVPGVGRCPGCRKEEPMDYWTAVCSECGQAVLEVVRGRELKVKSINVD